MPSNRLRHEETSAERRPVPRLAMVLPLSRNVQLQNEFCSSYVVAPDPNTVADASHHADETWCARCVQLLAQPPNMNLERVSPQGSMIVPDVIFQLAAWNETTSITQQVLKKPLFVNGQEHGFARDLSLIHISEPTRLGMISYAVFCLKKKK